MPCRQITTDIWDDARVQELTSTGQHVLFRLILGPETGPAGATRASVKRIAVDTNLDRTDVEAALDELVAAGLVRRYDDGWMWLPSFIKHQLSGPGFISGIRRQAAQCPDALRKAITRTLDALIGPGKDAIAENRAAKAADTPPPPDGAPRTRKHAPSRQEVDRPSSDHGQTHDTPPSDKGLFEREGQDKDQDRPNGLSVLVTANAQTSNGDGPGRPRGRPSPAQPAPDMHEHSRRCAEIAERVRKTSPLTAINGGKP